MNKFLCIYRVIGPSNDRCEDTKNNSETLHSECNLYDLIYFTGFGVHSLKIQSSFLKN